MKIIFFFLLFISATSLQAYGDHDIHISMCELRFNEETSSFEVSIKIFIDDLELALKKAGVTNLKIGTDQEAASADQAIAKYLHEHFSIVVDGISLKPDFLGKEITEDMLAVWCYVEFKKDVSKSSKCSLSNSILLDLYEDQKNIMDIRMNRTHKDYTILDAEKNTWNYTF